MSLAWREGHLSVSLVQRRAEMFLGARARFAQVERVFFSSFQPASEFAFSNPGDH
jgi:hypothetical protein